MGTRINITVHTLFLSLPATAICQGNSTETYNYYGDLKGGDTMSITHPGVIDNVYYYQIRIIYGLIAFD
jgi:hypothetical protein